MHADIAIIVLFLVSNLIVGMLSSRKIHSFSHFSVGHRAFSSFFIFATLSASFIGGGYTLGNAAKVFSDGLLYSFAMLGFSLKEILVATIIAPRMGRYHDCISIGDIVEKRYGRPAKVTAGVLGVLICTGILGAQVGAMGAIFNTFFHINMLWGVLIGFSVIIAYASLGGMRAVVYTDVLQFFVLVLGIPLTFFVGVHTIGGFPALIDKIPPTYLHFLYNKQQIFLFVSLFITFIFGETLVPPYVQRLLMSKTPQETKRGTLASGLLSIPFFLIAGGIGLVAYALNTNINPDMALPFVVQTALPSAFRGFVIAGLIAIIMSSAAGFLNAASVSFVNDIVKPLSNNSPKWAHSHLLLAKLMTILVGIGAVVFALSIKNVLDILLYAYNFWAPIILVPLLAVILGIKATKRDFFLGSTAGALAMLVWANVLNSPHHISAVVIGVLASFLCFGASRMLGSIQSRSARTKDPSTRRKTLFRRRTDTLP